MMLCLASPALYTANNDLQQLVCSAVQKTTKISWHRTMPLDQYASAHTKTAWQPQPGAECGQGSTPARGQGGIQGSTAARGQGGIQGSTAARGQGGIQGSTTARGQGGIQGSTAAGE